MTKLYSVVVAYNLYLYLFVISKEDLILNVSQINSE